MGFFKRLFGGEPSSDPNSKQTGSAADPQGIYIYVQCDNCKSLVRLRADKQYDLINEGGGFRWHKTIVDNRCFRQMPAVVSFNSRYEIVDAEITGGRFISHEEFEELEAAKRSGSTTQAGEADTNAE